MNTRALVKGSLSDLAARDGATLAESFLSVDAILIVDVSGSMTARDAPDGQSRHEAAESELRRLQETMPGKLAVVCFSDSAEFCPAGIPRRMDSGTNLAGALRFVQAADDTGMRFVVISDGQPDDENATLDVARQFTSRIDTVYIGPEGGTGRAFLQRLALVSETRGQYAESKAPGMLAEQVTLLLKATA
jgi:Mg-chelatase subunit ChlD